MSDPNKDPAVSDLRCFERKKQENDKSEGWIEDYIFKKGGKCYRVRHYDLQHTGTWTNEHESTWTDPVEITERQYNDLVSLSSL